LLNLLTEFQNIVNTLEEEKIEYAICGGIAMAIHGFLRTTVDIDKERNMGKSNTFGV
jgi:hypothetical protein